MCLTGERGFRADSTGPSMRGALAQLTEFTVQKTSGLVKHMLASHEFGAHSHCGSLRRWARQQQNIESIVLSLHGRQTPTTQDEGSSSSIPFGGIGGLPLLAEVASGCDGSIIASGTRNLTALHG
eukprot:807044-Amphidinium_carterae.1